MYAVVNTMSMREPIDPALVHRMQAELIQEARQIPGFVHASLIDLGDRTVHLVCICDSPAAVRDLHDSLGEPWLAANLAPLARSADRKAGPVVASSLF